ncbi:MAG: AtpZ/AtpI family protein [Desulfovibrionales bacterium]|uniref:AtpZ/AtpI family protein n=1 Tax=Desulfonatronum thioautotrophicum TaxID=617001 RepID=UPI0005EB15A8|nr:AtpZ/AtpI family protein [Desulfonatronum thioautotrophicum]TVR00750.1 MAG: AtpZ/AtpI family protein [Desulfovibrionales bacterium]
MFFRSNSKYKDLMQPFSQAGLLGIHLVASTFVGALIGWYLDKWLDTQPKLFLLFLVFGIIAGFKNMYMETKKIQRQLEKQDAAARQNKPQD